MTIAHDTSPANSKPKQTPPTMQDQIAALADQGDLNGVVDVLSSEVGYALSDKEKPELVRAALNAHAAKNGTAGIIDAVLGQALAFNAEMLICCQARIRSAMQHDSKQRGYLMGPGENLINDDLPRLARLEDRVVQLSKTIATVAHTLTIREAPVSKLKTRSNIVSIDSLKRGVANE